MKKIVRAISTMLLIFSVGWAIAAGQININQADAEAIATELKGVGEKKAQAIVDYRAEHGPFKSVTDLTSVKGIGDKIIEDNEDVIVLELN